MAAPLILARNFADAHRYAEQQGFKRGHYRVVTSVSSISGRRGADLHLVPGWDTRPDRFSMRSALRWTHLNVIEASERQRPPSMRITAVPDDTPPPQSHLDLVERALPNETVGGLEQLPLVADEEVRPLVEDTGNGDNMISEGGPVVAEPKRRRRRCKECGILVEPDEVDQHKKDHENDLLGGA